MKTMGMQASPPLCDIAIDDNVCLELLAKESCHTSTIFFHSGRSEVSGIQFGSQILRTGFLSKHCRGEISGRRSSPTPERTNKRVKSKPLSAY